MITVDPATYEPTAPRLVIVKSRLSHGAWVARVEKAQREASIMEKVVARVADGARLDAAIRKEVSASRRSWVIRHWTDFGKLGWEALIDERLPREPKIAKACGQLIESAREANQEIDVDEVLNILRGQKINPLPSPSTIRFHLRRADRRLGRRRRQKRPPKEVIELGCAGGELLLAAEIETGAINALTTAVRNVAEEAREASKGQVPERDLRYRDEMGRFTPEYNERRAREPGEDVASYLRTAEEKASGRVPSWPRFVEERPETIEAKLKALTFAPLVSMTQGWDALRSAAAADLGSLAGYAYMPSTLAKFTSALAVSGAGPRMLEALGINWHAVATQRWGEAGALAALYVDNHVKEVWTSMFTMSGKVARLNRVMPCITTTYAHTGAGVPIVASVQSGSAPLAPRLLEIVERAEKILGEDITRATIIDAEGSTFDVLEAFSKAGRVIITPLRPSRAPELELEHTAGSYYRPYRENDELRIAQAKLHHRASGRVVEVGALQIRRDGKERETVLLTTGVEHGYEGRDLADLYFSRWPLQENAFKEGAVVGLEQHRGNSYRMVANVAVVSELEKLQKQRTATEEALQEHQQAEPSQIEAVVAAERTHRSAQSRLATRRGRMDNLVETGKLHTKEFSKNAVELNEALDATEKASKDLEKAQSHLDSTRHKIAAHTAKLEKQKSRETQLVPRQQIRQIDVALDTILTSAKLTCLLLISFVLREYLPTISLTPQTFASRVFSVRGRRELRAQEESVIFYANPRDPEITGAIEAACTRLNDRKLERDGRKIRYYVEDNPNSPST